ncbi:MAG: bifunctional phosphoribosyl-AMP cyclohydrolase/phosphoribosyl-ATP diphosphatase HisIE [Clostridia bacterium]|nr:MAG: bifunctional phosphoribosyl-AMP cyclohydrolase/phosphoribosyl-ATP diphosphatase HisIE [Clostridia bacterium]
MRIEDVKEQDFLGHVKFDANGLIPAIIQDAGSSQVLMLAYMNEEALRRSLASGRTWFFSRSRQRLWLKGETSGNSQEIEEIFYDCDADTLLVKVRQEGVACHEGNFSCFHYPLEDQPKPDYGRIVDTLFAVIKERQAGRPEGSYTASLFSAGLDKILKKIGEEAAEVIIAAKGGQREEVVYEAGDLAYHLLVLLAEQGLGPEDVRQELARRRK